MFRKRSQWGAQDTFLCLHAIHSCKRSQNGFENKHVNAVMDGDLDGFINAYLKALSLGEIEK